ncbi:hypothetical protein [Homoserinibacter sp. GY 40078]|uniref:hypothetical protein n=1 Tax=Homoserinibacter sp. GY 40078 TaxID=2603275 RepID=UPI0011C85DBA|nr:hypothetical protein [Homoserinibacter sp. GY 40078]TXK19241.1 hypothetical protein FVQ89_04825 [Homoserinibacter sp. GY 40078]
MPRETQAQRIARIQEENARLQDELAVAREELGAAQEQLEARAAEPPIEPVGVDRRRRPGRAIASVALIATGAILAPVALVANTADRLLTDTDFFVQTLQPIVEDDAVQQLIISEVSDVIRTQSDVDRIVSDLFDGLDRLDLPPRAVDALRLLEGPAVQGVDALIERVVTSVVTSDAFVDVISESLRISHAQAIAALSGQGEVLVIGPSGEVGIALSPILDRVRTALTDAGLPFAQAIPDTDRVIVVAESSQLAQLVWMYQLAVGVGPWLQWVVLALFAGGVIAARRRSRALIGAGLAFAAASGVLGAALAVGRAFSLTATSGRPIGSAVGVIYDTAVVSLATAAVVGVLIGLGVALVAYLGGPTRGGRAVRTLADAGADSLREAGEHRGVTTGRFGELVFRARLGIRVAVGLIAAVILMFVRPLSPAIVVWTLVLALLVVAVARILERPPVVVSDAAEEPDPAEVTT